MSELVVLSKIDAWKHYGKLVLTALSCVLPIFIAFSAYILIIVRNGYSMKCVRQTNVMS